MTRAPFDRRADHQLTITLRPVAAYKIERPLGVLLFTPVAEEWSISKADGEPADFGHDMERHKEVENNGKYAGLADERSGITVTCHRDILVIKVVESARYSS
jgi:hypothetical protein